LTISALCACRSAAPPAVSSPSNPENSVAAFLKNAERQSEDDGQRREIQRGLRDMLEKSPAELRQARYQDYQGHENAWSITELLKHYFVPDPLMTLDDQRFFQEFREQAARAAIQQQLDAVDRALR
jgi:hypothetical protein